MNIESFASPLKVPEQPSFPVMSTCTKRKESTEDCKAQKAVEAVTKQASKTK